MELAFERAGMPIRWEGPRGLGEAGVVSEGALAGKKVVGLCADFFRPAEVISCRTRSKMHGRKGGCSVQGSPDTASSPAGHQKVATLPELLIACP